MTSSTVHSVFRGLKLPTPPQYTGKPEGWEDWSWRFKSYFTLADPNYPAMFLAAESADSVIEVSQLVVTDELGETDSSRVELSNVLYYALTQYCVGPPLQTVRQTTSRNGLEVWRLLNERVNLTKLNHGLSRLTKLLQPALKAEQDFLTWENELQHHQRESGTTLDDSVLIAIVLNGTSGQLQTHLRLNYSN